MKSNSIGVCGRSVSSIDTSITGDWPLFGVGDAAIDAARLADRRQKLPRRIGDHRPGDFQRPGDAGDRERPTTALVPGDKSRHGVRRPASMPIQSATSSVKKSLASRKRVDGFQADVVGIDEIGPGPARGPARRRPPRPERLPDCCRRSCARGATCSRPEQCRPLAGPGSAHRVGRTPGGRNGRRRRSSTWVTRT